MCAHSTLAVDSSWPFFFSGFSNTQRLAAQLTAVDTFTKGDERKDEFWNPRLPLETKGRLTGGFKTAFSWVT